MVEVELEAAVDEIDCPDEPTDIRLRTYGPSDARLWLDIHSATGVYDPVAPDLFDHEFGEQHEDLALRQLYATTPDGRAVGTATAWFPEPGRDPRLGRVHWVAVVPEYQRRGIGRWLTGEVVRLLGQLDYERVYLSTADSNDAAIGLYLSLGFRPLVRSPHESEVWSAIRTRLPEPLRRAVAFAEQ